MIRNTLSRINIRKAVNDFSPRISTVERWFSKQTNEKNNVKFNDQQAPYYTAKDIEFCPDRAKDVMQNYVQETAEHVSCDECDCPHESNKIDPSISQSDKDHVNIYQTGNSVSLYSVMQSNVPEPCATSDEAPSHLNMPGSSSKQDSKYLSGKIQTTHQSKQ